MKVLYFHQYFSTPAGTTGIRSYWMARKLMDEGHDVTIVCGSFTSADTGLYGPFKRGLRRGLSGNLKIIEVEIDYSNSDPLYNRALKFLRYCFRATVLALKEDYDLLFATTTPLTAGIPGIFGRWFRKKPFVFEVRDLWPELPKAMGVIKNPIVLWGLSFLEWSCYRSADHLIALSPGIADGIAKRGVDRRKITLVPNGCDLTIFSPDVKSSRPPQINPSDFVAIFAGTHGVANGLDAVLEAAMVLKSRERQDIKFLLVGDGQLKDVLRSRAVSECLDNVVFHDPVPKEKLAGLMAGADIGLQVLKNVSAFYYGTSPNKFFDYISSGLPVLNNYPGWVADLITANDCGYVAVPDDPVSFADKLEEAAGDHRALLRKGNSSLKLAEQQFSRANLATLWVDVLEEVHKLSDNRRS